MKTVFCPVKKAKIDGTECNMVCDVADRYLNSEVLPPDIIWNGEQKEIYLNCKYHNPIEKALLKNGQKVVVSKMRDGKLVASKDVDPNEWEFFPILESDIKMIVE